MEPPIHILLAFDPDIRWLSGMIPGIQRYAQEQGNWVLEFALPEQMNGANIRSDGVIQGGRSTYKVIT